MRRRELIAAALLGALACTWPAAAMAQKPAQPLPAVGFLHIASPDSDVRAVAAFRHGLTEAGYAVGRSVTIDFRWAKGREEALSELAAELVRRPVAVLVAMGGTAAADAAKRATRTIPIVFVSGTDPVNDGLVASRARPGGNITGIDWTVSALEPKRIELLRQVVPKVTDIAILVNPKSSEAAEQVKVARDAARESGVNIHVLSASNDRELDAIFANPLPGRAGALLVSPDPYFFRRRKQIVAHAGKLSLPAMYDAREYVANGGLMSYGSSSAEAARLAGLYAARILKGEKPADLPVIHPSRFEFVVNLLTAHGLGMTLPPPLLDTADEVYR
jgi:putative ABC transport system substrate-binding protein